MGRTQLLLSTNLETADQNTLLGNATLIFLKPEILFCGDPQPFRSPVDSPLELLPTKFYRCNLAARACALFKRTNALSLLDLALEPSNVCARIHSLTTLVKLENSAFLPGLFYTPLFRDVGKARNALRSSCSHFNFFEAFLL